MFSSLHFATGTLAQWILIGVVSFAAYRLSRGGQSGAALDYYKTSNETLAREIKELKASRLELLTKNAALEQRTDIAQAIKPLEDRLIEHDARTQEMFTQHMLILKQIADRLGPERE